jgi:hypothetical protein
MESDLAQIKLLLLAILGLQLLFVIANVACRLLGCGTGWQPDYKEWMSRGKYDQILLRTAKRLETHPDDMDALYFRAKALERVGLTESARDCIRQIVGHDQQVADSSKRWLASLSAAESSDS